MKKFNKEIFIPAVILLGLAIWAIGAGVYEGYRPELAVGVLLAVLGIALLLLSNNGMTRQQLLELQEANRREAWCITQRAQQAQRQRAAKRGRETR